MSTILRHFVHRTFASYPRVLSIRQLSSSAATLKDPWPMPHTPEHIASTASPADLPPPEPLPRPGETTVTKRARLVYQSRKRGTLESDLLLSTFAQEHLGAMDAEELSEFDKVRLKKYPNGERRLN
jgi:succinate dehydrogenase assembly factor 2